MRRAVVTLALIAVGYLAGTLAPHASAADSLDSLVTELRGIRTELTQIRRVMERQK